MRMLRSVSALLVALGMTVPVLAQSDPVVDAPAGKLRGTTAGDLNVFKGIPYALPPVGMNRWKLPVAMPAWQGVRDATKFGAACVQPVRKVASIYADDVGPISEDCLFLNVWAPRHAKQAPVFVWIYGGALTSGASNLGMYDGA